MVRKFFPYVKHMTRTQTHTYPVRLFLLAHELPLMLVKSDIFCCNLLPIFYFFLSSHGTATTTCVVNRIADLLQCDIAAVIHDSLQGN